MWQLISCIVVFLIINKISALDLDLFFDDCDGTNMILESQTLVIDSNFMHDSKITCLNLENKGITGLLSDAFSELPNLEYLNLANNKLTKEQFLSFGKHEKLKILVLDEAIRGGYRNLTGYTGYLKVLNLKGYFPNLERLYLRNNSIAIISTTYGKSLLPNLTHLYLSNNELTNESPYFDRSFTWLPKSLKEIHFENNDIDYLGLGEFHNLEWISLDDNRISDITIWDIPKLEYFSANNNEISWLSDFSGSPELKILNLANNKIRHLNHIYKLPFLSHLILDNNFFHSIPKIKSIPRIKVLSMRCNELKIVGSLDFLSMSSLERLYLDNNRIKYINKKAFENLESLEILSLTENKLTYLSPGWMDPLKNLNYLNLKGNAFLNVEALGYTDNSELYFQVWPENNVMNVMNFDAKITHNMTLHFDSESSMKICKKHVSKAIHSFDWTEHKS